jgi:hypothetical protein
MVRLVGSPEDPLSRFYAWGSQRYMCLPCMDIRPGERDGEVYTDVRVSPKDFASSIRRTPSICHIWFAKELATRNPRRADPSLTLTRTQYPAIVSNRENNKPLTYAGFATPCNYQQPLTAHS